MLRQEYDCIPVNKSLELVNNIELDLNRLYSLKNVAIDPYCLVSYAILVLCCFCSNLYTNIIK